MTDKSIEERLQAWVHAGIASMALLADLNAALAEIRRLREELTEYKQFTYEYRDHCAELDEERRVMREESASRLRMMQREMAMRGECLLELDLRALAMASETARRESAEALLREWCGACCTDEMDVAESRTDAHFARFDQRPEPEKGTD